MQRAVLFDLDDTLHDRTGTIPEFVRSQARRILGIQSPGAEAFSERFIQLEQRGRVWKDQVYRELGHEFPQARHACERLLDDYLHSFPKACRLRPDAAQLLRKLRENSCKIGIVTNGRSDMQRAVIDALKLGDLVDVVVISEQAGWRKPDARIFYDALTQLHVDAASAVFVGDDPRADVEGALSAGFGRVYWFDAAAAGGPIELPSGALRVRNFAELSARFSGPR